MSLHALHYPEHSDMGLVINLVFGPGAGASVRAVRLIHILLALGVSILVPSDKHDIFYLLWSALLATRSERWSVFFS